MENSKIFHVESDPDFRDMVKTGLPEVSNSRHKVVANPGTNTGLENTLDLVEQGKLDVNTLLLSDDISHAPDGIDVISVDMEIRRRNLNFRIIGLGNIRISGAYGINTDREYKKSELNLSKLARDLDYLPEPETPEERTEKHEGFLLRTYGLSPKLARRYLADNFGGITPEEIRKTNPIAHGSHDIETFVRIALGEEPVYLLERVYQEVREEDEVRQAQRERRKGNISWQAMVSASTVTEHRSDSFREISRKLRSVYSNLC